jgi:diguanylate cyclase (GGDEF)-like protein
LRISGWPIRRKIALAFLVAAVLPLALSAGSSLYWTNSSLEKQARVQMQSRVDALGAALDSSKRSMRDQVAAYSMWTELFVPMDTHDVPWLEQNATTWVTQNSAMTGAQALTPGLQVISAAGDFSRVSLRDSAVVATARDSGKLAVDLEAVAGRLFILGAGPVVAENGVSPRPHGYIVFGEPVTAAKLAELASFIGARQLDLRIGGTLTLSSAGSAARAFPANARVGTPYVSGSNTYLLSELRNRSGRPQAIVGVTVDSTAISATRSTLQKTTMWAVFGSLALALAAGLAVTRMVSRPLRRLTDAVKGMAGGEIQQHVTIETRDELGEVAGAFNSMSDQLAEAFAELQRLSETDALTGLLNHRAIHHAIEKETARGRRYAAGFGLLVLDIDEFKLLNDTYGHPAGDQVLKRLADVLTNNTRETDVIGRQGGDEFLILLPETRPPGAAAAAEKVLAAVSEQAYITADGERVPVRVSIGVACFPEDGDRANVLIAHADANLYTSKRRGGNMITSCADGKRAEVTTGAFGMLEALVTAVDNKDRYTLRHSEEVTEHALSLAKAVGLSEESQRTMRIVGLLHDVGKIGVPDGILRKPGRLTPDEFEIIKQHPALGEALVQEVPNLDEIRAGVVSHHERWDGTGYPRGLSGEAIPLFGRIMSVADAFSAMTSDRPYRKALSVDEAVAELRAGAGSQFDPALVEPFIQTLRAKRESKAPAKQEA